MMRVSNTLLGILNIITLLLSIPIIAGGVWLSKQQTTDCEQFLHKPAIALGVFILLVSIAGLVGTCCRITWLLWVYLFVMFLSIILLFCFTIFGFAVTGKGAGEAIAGKGYKEYRLWHYSHWLRESVEKHWNREKSCLIASSTCRSMLEDQSTPAEDFNKRQLSAVQSGCCKPSNDCNFKYVSPANWTRPARLSTSNADCEKWSNDANTLCYECDSCKAGLIDEVKRDWKKMAVLDIVFLIFLVIVYAVGCCAFKNIREDNLSNWKPNP